MGTSRNLAPSSQEGVATNAPSMTDILGVDPNALTALTIALQGMKALTTSVIPSKHSCYQKISEKIN